MNRHLRRLLQPVVGPLVMRAYGIRIRPVPGEDGSWTITYPRKHREMVDSILQGVVEAALDDDVMVEEFHAPGGARTLRFDDDRRIDILEVAS